MADYQFVLPALKFKDEFWLKILRLDTFFAVYLQRRGWGLDRLNTLISYDVL